MIAQPASAAARAISYFPLTAPMAMPGRIAMGAAAWWEPVAAAALTLAAIAGLVLLAGRIYTSAILHGGPGSACTTPGEAQPHPAPAQAAQRTRHAAAAAAGPRSQREAEQR